MLTELVCARCAHAADLHGVEGFNSGCMVRNPTDCDCKATWEAIEARAIRRMTADLPVNTESDPDAEARSRASQDAQS